MAVGSARLPAHFGPELLGSFPQLEFKYKSGDIDLHGTDIAWMVVRSDSKGQFKGNEDGPYPSRGTAEDNGSPGSDDTFKIEIWLGVVPDTEYGPPTRKVFPLTGPRVGAPETADRRALCLSQR